MINDEISENSFNDVRQKKLFVSQKNEIERLILNQIYEIKLKVLAVKNQKNEYLSYDIEKNSNSKLVLFSGWNKVQNHYETSFYFKLVKNNQNFPSISISLLRDKNIIEKQSISLKKVPIIKLNHETYFSQIIAQELVLKKHKITEFDENSYILNAEFLAILANSNDFNLSFTTNQEISLGESKFPRQNLFYHGVFDKNISKIEFSYFNLKTNDYTHIKFPVIVQVDQLSTQTGLNPKKSKFEMYKRVAIICFLILFLIICIYKKYIGGILIVIILGLYYYYIKEPFSDFYIEKNSNVFILPTKNSTIFYRTPDKLKVDKLGQKDDYIKILLPDGKIGWSRHENIIKN